MGKKTQRKQYLLKRLTVIDDSIKGAIIKAWIKRCKMRYMARFIEWRVEYTMSVAPDHLVGISTFITFVFREKSKLLR
jgi:hypothetical protein